MEEEIGEDLQGDPEEEEMAAPVAVIPMPAVRHHTALQFSEDEPRELGKYFKELETLLRNVQIIDNDIMIWRERSKLLGT